MFTFDANNNLNVNSVAPATQPVSGTVTANQGTANTSANAWPINIIGLDGATKATTKTSSTQAATADTSLTVQLSPVQPNLTTALNVSDSAAEASLVLIQQELRQQSAFPN